MNSPSRDRTPRESLEVRNALAVYEAMNGWDAKSRNDLIIAHRLLMVALVDDAGRIRSWADHLLAPMRRI